MNRETEKILSIENLSGGYTKAHDILQGVYLNVERGQAVGIIGLNGSGKSTLAKAIMNTLPYRNGKLLLSGKDISRYSTKQLSDAGVALFLQGGRVFDELSVWENLSIIAGNNLAINSFAASSPQVLEKAEDSDFRHNDILCGFSLLQQTKRELQKLRADKLSGGQRHQLALAMCLLKKPILLILDEPSAGLSPLAVNEMYVTLETLRQKTNLTVILIEQNITRAIKFCDSVNMLQNGRIPYHSNNKDIKEIEKIMFNK
jgi:ABC-type branched-subunit amino acid transport system ATPase component